MSGLRQPTQTPKISSRKPPIPSKLNPSSRARTQSQTQLQGQLNSESHPRSPPLTTSHNSNAQSIFPSSSPSNYLVPKEGGSSVKIKIKAQTTPEARTRLLKPAGLGGHATPSANGHTSSTSISTSTRTPVPLSYKSPAGGYSAYAGLRAGSGVGRSITPSDSEGSLASGWEGPGSGLMALGDTHGNERGSGLGFSDELYNRHDEEEEEEMGRTESVMVTVR
jgi:hypothetical protein